MQADCIVDSHFVPELRLPDQDPVYISDSGIHVYLHDEKESRYLCDYFTGKVKMRFRDDGEKKHLELANNPRLVPITELKLLNILGMEKTMSEHGKFILHASFIGTDQGALLFTAPSGTGKSTQAALWAQFRKAEIINGDRTGLWKGPDGFLAGIR